MNPIKGFEDFHKMISVESWLKNVKDIGHRGAGIARRTDRAENILENTIASFNFASLNVSWRQCYLQNHNHFIIFIKFCIGSNY